MPNDTRTASAACTGVDPELFFGHSSAAAKKICAGCPIRLDCLKQTLDAELAYALDDDSPAHRGGWITAYGVAGGMGARERSGILTRRARDRARLEAAA